jgi:hypothetical protein
MPRSLRRLNLHVKPLCKRLAWLKGKIKNMLPPNYEIRQLPDGKTEITWLVSSTDYRINLLYVFPALALLMLLALWLVRKKRP